LKFSVHFQDRAFWQAVLYDVRKDGDVLSVPAGLHHLEAMEAAVLQEEQGRGIFLKNFK
jgi:hypothetical protein